MSAKVASHANIVTENTHYDRAKSVLALRAWGTVFSSQRKNDIFFDQEWNATHLLTKKYGDIDFPHDKVCIENYVAWRK